MLLRRRFGALRHLRFRPGRFGVDRFLGFRPRRGRNGRPVANLRVAVQAATATLLAATAKARPRWREVAPFSGPALRYGVPTAASDALITLHRRADVFLLSAFGR